MPGAMFIGPHQKPTAQDIHLNKKMLQQSPGCLTCKLQLSVELRFICIVGREASHRPHMHRTLAVLNTHGCAWARPALSLRRRARCMHGWSEEPASMHAMHAKQTTRTPSQAHAAC